MLHSTIRKLEGSAFIFVALLATHCSADAGDADEASADSAQPGQDAAEQSRDTAEANVGVTTQAFSWGVFASWARSSNLPVSSNRADIGSDAGMTCFLAGVGGNLSSAYGAPQPVGSLYTTASAGVYRSGGRWYIEAQTGSGSGKLKASAMCVNSVVGRTAVYSWTGGAAKQMLPVKAGRRCFLTRVRNSDMWYSNNDFGSNGDTVRVWSDGASWWIGGSGNAHGSASCIDVAKDLGEWRWNGATTQKLAYNDRVPGTQCFLTGVEGAFRTNSFTDGVFIGYEAGLNQYNMTVSAGKSGWARCVE